jgi:hypothetical protein
MKISTRNIEALIRDLVKKHPAGLKGDLNHKNYFAKYPFSSHYNRYIFNPTLSHLSLRNRSFYGYTPEYLWRAYEIIRQSGVEKHVIDAFCTENLTRTQRVRRVNRVTDRLKRATDFILVEGAEGTWGIRWAKYEDTRFFVHAISEEQAIAETYVVSSLFGHDMCEKPYAKFINIEEPQQTNERNVKLSDGKINRAREKVRVHEKRLVDVKKVLEKAQEEAAVIMIASKL